MALTYIENPCKDCKRKGCGVYHDECEKYLEYSAYRNEMNSIRHKRSNTYKTAKSVNDLASVNKTGKKKRGSEHV